MSFFSFHLFPSLFSKKEKKSLLIFRGQMEKPLSITQPGKLKHPECLNRLGVMASGIEGLVGQGGAGGCLLPPSFQAEKITY